MRKNAFATIAIVLIIVGILIIASIWYYGVNQTVSYLPPSLVGNATPSGSSAQSIGQGQNQNVTSARTSSKASPSIAASPYSRPSVEDGYHSLKNQNFTYRIDYTDPACAGKMGGIFFSYPDCDAALAQLNNLTHQKVTLVPSFWKAMPSLAKTGDQWASNFLFGDGSQIFIYIYRGHGEEVGSYQFDIATQQLQTLTFQALGCPVFSPDFRYVADDYATSSKFFVKIFNFGDNKYIYTDSGTLGPSQTLKGGPPGPGCGDVAWAATSSVVWGIHDSSKLDQYGNYQLVQQKQFTIPAKQ